MRKVGSITPLWGQEMWIRPHFKMLSSLDKNVAILQNQPLGDYQKQHGYTAVEDNSEKILKEIGVETHRSSFFGEREFSSELYNEALPFVQDMDIVFRLDPDMFFVKSDWEELVSFIRNTEYDCYRMDFSSSSINYYGDFEHGLRDAIEKDIIAFSPKKNLRDILSYDSVSETFIPEKLLCHHFRGWNKKSVPQDWYKTHGDTAKQFGGWISAPEEIRLML